MSKIFKIGLLLSFSVLCLFSWFSSTGHLLLSRNVSLVFPVYIAFQFFFLGCMYHKEKTEKNNDS